MQRRAFLKLAGLVPLLTYIPAYASSERTLVLLELKGGNDGLNTVVPYADPEYYRQRPKLGVSRDTVLRLTDSLGLNPALEFLLPAWQGNDLAIVLGVGYPKPNRSHFRSIEIWDTASGSDKIADDGWVSQLLRRHISLRNNLPDAIVMDSGGLGPVRGGDLQTVVMDDPQRFMHQASRLQTISESRSQPALAHILAVRAELNRVGDELKAQLQKTPEPTHIFPKQELGRQLKQVAKLLLSGFQVPVIKVALSGFDNHFNQLGQHNNLLQQLAESLAVFRDTMRTAGLWDRILIMTYSEFGRRVAENANRGTDHGTAAPHFFLGGRVKGGLYGRQPSLTDLQSDDLLHHVDYRDLYATVARQWWNVSGDIFDKRFTALDCIA